MNERRIRNQKGAAVTGLVIALFMFIMLAGFFAFDSSRLQMAQRELTATCDAASLAGTAMLTSLDIANDDATASKLGTAQAQACAYARNMFQNGNMLGQSLGSANVVSPYSAVAAIGSPGDCNVMISLADPQNQFAGVSPTYPDRLKGRAIMCYAGYTYNPVFLGAIGVGKVLLQANSGGGLPQVDAVLVFDYSGSMDDATSVTFIRRTWDSTGPAPLAGSTSNGQMDYSVLGNGTQDGSSGAGPATNHGVVHYIEVPPPGSSHRMSDYLQHDYVASPNGVQLNVLPPQSLPVSDNIYSMSANKYVFDFNLRANSLPYYSAIPKVGGPAAKFRKDFGTPPGNCTLAYPFGYGQFYNESSPMLFTPAANANAAYNTNASFIGSLIPAEHPRTTSTAFRYPAYVNTGADNHIYTDLVVNIANPGTWPYAQPLNGPNNFVDFTFTFPSQEPDSALAGQTFRFENIGVLTEAARGNLDVVAGTNYFTDALLDRGSVYSTTSGTIASKQSTTMTSTHRGANYQRAYQRLAMLYSQPIATAIDGAYGGFFQKINTLTDCRFGLVGFSNSATSVANPSGPNFTSQGSSHQSAADQPNSFFVSAQYNGRNIGHRYRSTTFTTPEYLTAIGGGAGSGFRQPRRALAKPESQDTSYTGVVGGLQSSTLNAYCAPWSALAGISNANGLENGTPLSDTATAEALTTARAMFHNGTRYDIATMANNRPAAKHAIVFFTDGVPNSADAGPTLTQAQGCKGEGIAVFTIGLDVTNNPVLQGSQVTFLGNLPTGLAGASGNGGKFFPCASAATVRDSFSAVARRLTQGQR
ncbi:MAG: VWA domain-containing protein [Candidatus Obscuribacterales bacterium]|jgi:Flp pilus assembly protein TadG